ncbi:hypothetical protein [Salinilacihabitans rarus]|uniref:hypothetical protein n=1 Tax=Salinilacihabitans rarus TaxID=2961596 RepID=UPI0020C90A02|nr:hypothetical protein [Salinilacihabitans rarus]
MMKIRLVNGKRVIDKWDDVFAAVMAEPRRQIIVSLLDTPPDHSTPLPESAMNPNVPVDPETLRRELLHQHLPMLADRDFIDWEADPFVVSRGPRFEEVGIVFEALHAQADEIPDSLVVGCQRLEEERQFSSGELR